MLGVALLAAACGTGPGTESEPVVTSQIVSHETTQDILVFAPESAEALPVVWMMHGVGGSGGDMAQLATELAGEGFVVFAPTFRTDLSSQQGSLDAVTDAECGYRFARSVAADYGGDLDRPMTFVGWSLGASFALQGGLTEQIDPSGEFLVCFDEVPRADVIFAISGCHYEFEGAQFDFDPSGWGNQNAKIVLLAGADDAICPAWQSGDAATELAAAGFDVDIVLLDGADHFAPIFQRLENDELVAAPKHPAGQQTLDAILRVISAG